MPALAELPSATVAAVLLPGERPRVDAWPETVCFAVVHRDSVPEAVRTVRERPVDAVLVSVHRCPPEQVVVGEPSGPGVPRYSHGRPGVAARSGRHRNAAPARRLGCPPGGGRHLAGGMESAAARGRAARHAAVARIQAPIMGALSDAPPDARLFLEALIRLAPETSTVTALAERHFVRPSTLMSRFARAGLPSPKNYLAAVRLLHAAYLFQATGLSGGRRGLSPGVLLTPELRAASPSHAGDHRGRVPPPLSVRARAGALRGIDDRALPGDLANLPPGGGGPIAGGHLRRWYLRRIVLSRS